MKDISILIAWLEKPDANNHIYHYYCCDKAALHATKKFLFSKGYRIVRTCMTIRKDQIPELQLALQNPVELCDSVCRLVKEKLIFQCGGNQDDITKND